MSQFDEIMRFDPLDQAEKLTGTSIHDQNSDAQRLGLGMFLVHNQRKQQFLKDINDTRSGLDFDEACKLLEESLLGFKLVYQANFDYSPNYTAEPKIQHEEERFYWSKKRGIYLHITSHTLCEKHVNDLGVNFEIFTDMPEVSRDKQHQIVNELYQAADHCSGGLFFEDEKYQDLMRDFPDGKPYPAQRWYRQCHLDGREGLLTRLQAIDLHPHVRFNPFWLCKFPCMLYLSNYAEMQRPRDQENKFVQHYGNVYANAWKTKLPKCDPEFAEWLQSCNKGYCEYYEKY